MNWKIKIVMINASWEVVVLDNDYWKILKSFTKRRFHTIGCEENNTTIDFSHVVYIEAQKVNE